MTTTPAPMDLTDNVQIADVIRPFNGWKPGRVTLDERGLAFTARGAS